MPARSGTSRAAIAKTALPIDDTIRMPWTAATGAEETVVRPALAILFRLALGQAADAYTSRFLRYERTGRAGLGWHWPSFLLPSAWAFYRKLWLSGAVFAGLPFLGAAAFAAVEPAVAESTLAWLAGAVAAIWLLPAVTAALLANGLLYRHVKRRVEWAEAGCQRIDEVATLLAARHATAPWAAVLFGGAALVLGATVLAPRVSALYQDQLVRTRVAASLAAVRPLQAAIEDAWLHKVSFPRMPDYAAAAHELGLAWRGVVNISPVSGRLRLDLGPALPELHGKTILLAPAIDSQQQVQWFCVPVDVPRRYLPRECVS